MYRNERLAGGMDIISLVLHYGGISCCLSPVNAAAHHVGSHRLLAVHRVHPQSAVVLRHRL